MAEGITAFLGPAHQGPLDSPVLVESLAEFTRVFGAETKLPFAPGVNHLALALRLFFANGGQRALVLRVTDGLAPARHDLPLPGAAFVAAVPGGGDGLAVSVTVRRQRAVPPERLATGMVLEAGPPRRGRLLEETAGPLRVVLETSAEAPPRLLRVAGTGGADGRVLQPLVLDVTIGEGDSAITLRNLSPHPDAPRWIGEARADPALPLRLVTPTLPSGPTSRARLAVRLLRALYAAGPLHLAGATPATTPGPAAYAAALRLVDGHPAEFLAAPAAAALPPDAAAAVRAALVADATATGRFALLSCAPGQELPAARAAASPDAALYTPWLHVAFPEGKAATPPEGAVAGLLCSPAAARGPHRAGASLRVAGAIRPTRRLDAAAQEVLALARVNPIAERNGTLLLLGAATTTRDPAWPDLPSRRVALALARTLRAPLAKAAATPDDSGLRSRLLGEVEKALHALWRAGALHGARPEEAFRLGWTTPSPGTAALELRLALRRPGSFVPLHLPLAPSAQGNIGPAGPP